MLISLDTANAYVVDHHRHNGPLPGHRFSLGAFAGDDLVGVAIVGNPVARTWAALGWRLEVRRTCTNGYPMINSMLYAGARREAYRLGARSLITYTRDDEPGTSLIAAGWYRVGHRIRYDTWDTPTRRRKPIGGKDIGKTTWEAW